MKHLEFIKRVVNSIQCNDLIFCDFNRAGFASKFDRIDSANFDVITYTDFLADYGFYVQKQFELCFYDTKTVSKELEVCLSTLERASLFYHLDNWENIKNYIIEPLASDVWRRDEKVRWKISLLDDKTANALKKYMSHYWG